MNRRDDGSWLHPSAWVALLEAVVVLTTAVRPATADRVCSAVTGVEELVACVAVHMPQGGSEGYRLPTTGDLGAWRAVAREMLDGACEGSLPASLAGSYERRWLAAEGPGRDYCVLVETLDGDGDGLVDRGWGTFVVARGWRREIHLQVPHPLYDISTETEGAALLVGAAARSLLVAGAERNANRAASPCQPDYQVADVAHNAATPFQAVTEALAGWIGDHPGTVLQLHGLGAVHCQGVDVFMTNGGPRLPPVGSPLPALQAALVHHNPGWIVAVPTGGDDCDYNGGSNVQGRLLNGVAAEAVCSTAAGAPGGRFVHVEQKRACREAAAWVRALRDVWPGPRVLAARRRLLRAPRVVSPRK